MAMRRVRPVRIDGTEFENRQIVGEQNRIRSTYKTYLKILFGLHLTVLIMMWAKVFCENAVTYFGMESVFWRKLDLPPAYLWEYVWCLSIIPNILALYAMPNNRIKLMTYAYYGQFITGILPCFLGLALQAPKLLAYIADPVNTETPKFKGLYPMVTLWFLFFCICFQLHIYAIYFKYYLLAAWNPLPAST